MRLIRHLVILALIAACFTLSPVSPIPARAQGGQSWLQVWLVPGIDASHPSTVQYRDANQNILASYTLGAGTPSTVSQGGGRIYSTTLNDVMIFDPHSGKIALYVPPGKPANTDTTVYNLMNIAPNPNGQNYAYGIVMLDNQMQNPATSWVYAATGAFDDRVIFQEQRDPFMGVGPLDWSADGSTLLLEDLPQGVGGYILFWQYQNVRALNLAANTVTPLGNLDGFSSDLQFTAKVEHSDQGVTGLTLTQVSTGQSAMIPLPPLGEQTSVGGGAFFSPSGSKVAYQAARGEPDNEKYWTILVTANQARVLFQDPATSGGVRYGNIGGWLDENTLVLGSRWSQQSALVDANTGAVLREVPGAFLGYAVGLTSATGFAPSGVAYAQCPGAPISRLTPGARGRVTITGGGLTNVRTTSGTQAEKVGTVTEGSTFTVQSGPECADNYAWWYVQFDSGLYGAVAEGDMSGYFLEPWQ